jgi:hypothetical protein
MAHAKVFRRWRGQRRREEQLIKMRAGTTAVTSGFRRHRICRCCFGELVWLLRASAWILSWTQRLADSNVASL